MLTELRQRIRDVRQGPDGLLYVLIEEEDGALLRIESAQSRPPYSPVAPAVLVGGVSRARNPVSSKRRLRFAGFPPHGSSALSYERIQRCRLPRYSSSNALQSDRLRYGLARISHRYHQSLDSFGLAHLS